ncbi:MAG TPA: GspH/FimT family pseudopilin [Pseudomonadales bacterium]
MTRPNYNKNRMQGVSLLEILIATAILGIIISVAIPSMSTFGANQRLVGAAEQIHGHLQQARSEAIARGMPVYVNFTADGTSTWTYGVSTTNACTLTVTDPTAANACILVVNDGDATVDGIDGADADALPDIDTDDRVLMRYPGSDYRDIELALAGFSSANQIVFDPIRGTSSNGNVNLEGSTGNQLRVAISRLGRVAVCSPDGSVDAYGTCAP